MFKDVQCEHRWSHGTHQADSPILAKCAPALRCRWLQQLPLFGSSVHPRLLEGEAHRPVLSLIPTKLKSQRVKSGDLRGQGNAGTRLARIGLSA